MSVCFYCFYRQFAITEVVKKSEPVGGWDLGNSCRLVANEANKANEANEANDIEGKNKNRNFSSDFGWTVPLMFVTHWWCHLTVNWAGLLFSSQPPWNLICAQQKSTCSGASQLSAVWAVNSTISWSTPRLPLPVQWFYWRGILQLVGLWPLTRNHQCCGK